MSSTAGGNDGAESAAGRLDVGHHGRPGSLPLPSRTLAPSWSSSKLLSRPTCRPSSPRHGRSHLRRLRCGVPDLLLGHPPTGHGSAGHNCLKQRRGPLDRDDLFRDRRVVGAANYLAVGQIHLSANPLLREPLQPTDQASAAGTFRHGAGLNLVCRNDAVAVTVGDDATGVATAGDRGGSGRCGPAPVNEDCIEAFDVRTANGVDPFRVTIAL